jgi:hypothetical protein
MNHKREAGRALGFLLAILLLAANAIPALAATQGDVTGTFGINATPSVTSVTLTDTSLTPQSSYTITVAVSDADTIDDIQTVVMKLWYDSNGGTPNEAEFNGANADAKNAAVLTWTKSGQSAVAPVLTPGSTSWNLESYTVPSSSGDFTGTTFTWSYTVKIGKVATETALGTDKWQIGAKATDAGTASHFAYDSTNASMNWYGEVSVPSATVNWGTVSPGTDFGGTNSQQALVVTVTYVANGAYDEKVKSSATWNGSSYAVVSGTHDGGQNQAMLTDSGADFVTAGVAAGDIVHNTTDGSSGTITAVTATTVTATLAGGSDNDWDNGDAYSITVYQATLDSSGNTSSRNQFAIKADDSATLGSAVLVDSTGVAIDISGVQTSEAGDGEPSNNLWLRLANSFAKDTYSGTISYIIANGT